MDLPETPELDKMSAALPDAHVVSGFYDWMGAQGYVIAKYVVDRLCPAFEPPEKLLAAWKGIDLDKVEQEKMALLKAIREAQDASA